MAGRKPKVGIDNKVSKKIKKVVDAIEENTPILKSQMFEAPESLNKDELKIWNWLVNIFRDMSGCYVSDADKMTMEIYCKAKVEYDKACKEWSKNPEFYSKIEIGKDKNGNPKYQIKVNPFYNIKRDFATVMLKYLSELGISPTGRAKHGLQASKSDIKKDRDDILNLLNRPDDI